MKRRTEYEYHSSQAREVEAPEITEGHGAQAERPRGGQVAQSRVAVGLQTAVAAEAPDRQRITTAQSSERVAVAWILRHWREIAWGAIFAAAFQLVFLGLGGSWR